MLTDATLLIFQKECASIYKTGKTGTPTSKLFDDFTDFTDDPLHLLQQDVKLNMSNCATEVFTATNPTQRFYRTWGSSTGKTLISDIVAEFGSPANTLCPIKEWFISSDTGTVKVLPTSPIGMFTL